MRVDNWERLEAARAAVARLDPLPPVPQLTAERLAWLRAAGPADIRITARVPLQAIADALGVDLVTINKWERGGRMRRIQGSRAFAGYCRVIAGLARHLEVAGE